MNYQRGIEIVMEGQEMGVYINLEIMPHHIEPSDWEKVYHETLELVHAYPFMDKYVDEETHDHAWVYTTRTIERNIPFCDNQMGWHTIGDEASMKMAESFSFVKDLTYYKKYGTLNGNGDDILISQLYGDFETNEQLKPLKVKSASVFNEKTQGRPYHIPLLAIACLIECRFPKYAQVSGDISVGQMKEAVKWANTNLKKPITLTERTNNEIVLQRIEQVISNRDAILEVLMRLTLNEKDINLGNLIRTHFTADVINSYYKKMFKSNKLGTIGFSSELSDYLRQGFLLEDACEICVLDPNGCCYDAQEFVDGILDMHWADENERHESVLPLEINPADSAVPETVYSMFGKSMMKMAGFQETVAPHLTYDKVVTILKQKMDGICDITPLKVDDANQGIGELYDKMNELFEGKLDEFTSDNEKYTVNDVENLITWEEGDTIHPNIEEFISKAKRFIVNGSQEMEELLDYFDRSSVDGKRAVVLLHNQYFYIHKDVWEFVFKNIENIPFIHHYLSLLLIEASSLDTNELCKSLANNLALFHAYIMNDIANE